MKTIPLTTLLVGLLSSEAAAIGASIGYTIRMDKNMKKAFDNLNSKLGNDALEPEIKDNYKEDEELTISIENVTSDISIAEVQLQEQKLALETIQSESTKQHTLEQPTLSNDLGEMKLYIQDIPASHESDKQQKRNHTLVKKINSK